MIDLTKLKVHGGKGGNGCISFRREKFVPYGGPDGGNGGDGGDVYVAGDSSLNTLMHLSYTSLLAAGKGAHGSGKKKFGGNGADLIIKVPVGTLVWQEGDEERRRCLVDVADENPVLICKGGRGGRGTATFTSAINQEPLLAEGGEGGETLHLVLELKLLADVGMVGKPNAGKSTIMGRCYAARPKVAPYAFTTTDPVLGTVIVGDERFLLGEVPGLIEGAHAGVGLGHEFLRHAERTRLLWHVVDGTSDDVLKEIEDINRELELFGPSVGSKPQVLVINKMDEPQAKENVAKLGDKLQSRAPLVFFISAATGEGIQPLIAKTFALLDLQASAKEGVDAIPLVARKIAPKYTATRIHRERGVFVVESPYVDRLMAMANIKDWSVRVQLWKELQRRGVTKALEREGIKAGDTVRLGKVEMVWE